MSERITYLDGMRGVAALMVFTIHAGGFGLQSLGPIGQTLDGLCRYGVTIFFVLSAYSLCLSVDMDRPDWLAFYVRRFFRIVPLYFLVLAVAVVLQIATSRASPNLWPSVAAHFTFANIVLPQYANDILSVEWSIPVEVSFYVLFPIFFALVQRRPIWLIVMAIGFSFPQIRDKMISAVGGPAAWTLPFTLYAFVLGLIAYRAVPLIKASEHGSLGFGVAALALFAWCALNGEDGLSGPLFAGIAVLLIFNAELGGVARRALSFPALVWVGKVSFSVYLLHPLILGTSAKLGFPVPVDKVVDLGLTIGLASLSFWLVESKAQGVGRRWLRSVAKIGPAASDQPNARRGGADADAVSDLP